MGERTFAPLSAVAALGEDHGKKLSWRRARAAEETSRGGRGREPDGNAVGEELRGDVAKDGREKVS